MTEFSESDSYLAGQAQAITSFVQAVLWLHPDPEKLVDTFLKMTEQQEAKLLGQLVDDSYVEGFAHICSVVEVTMKKLQKDRWQQQSGQ